MGRRESSLVPAMVSHSAADLGIILAAVLR